MEKRLSVRFLFNSSSKSLLIHFHCQSNSRIVQSTDSHSLYWTDCVQPVNQCWRFIYSICVSIQAFPSSPWVWPFLFLSSPFQCVLVINTNSSTGIFLVNTDKIRLINPVYWASWDSWKMTSIYASSTNRLRNGSLWSGSKTDISPAGKKVPLKTE